jgi:UDP-N-acetylglucosamine 1-carboxyvinyltransferase
MTMHRLVIDGGPAISGAFRPAGNKNAALPMLAACLLTDEPVILHQVPCIQDVRVMLDILAGMGVTVEEQGRTVRLCAGALRSTVPDAALCRRVRASILLAGPLAARHGRATLPVPGGDVIGRRRLDTHLSGLRALGFTIQEGDHFEIRRDAFRGADLLLDEASVTATENLLMAAALADGTTTLYHAACEPHVQDLCGLLIAMGARIEGHGTNRVTVTGVPRLHGAEHAVGPDYIEVGSFLVAAAVTGGDLLVQDVRDDMTTRVLRRGLQKLGIAWEDDEAGLRLRPATELAVQPDLGFPIPKIEDGIWPAFPSDLMSVAIVAATQARGSILFFEKLFESRMVFVDRLIEMGAHIIQCDPHRVLVQGPSPLRAIHMTSPDIRAGMAMVIAALAATGTSIIENAHMIDRGYEAIDKRLSSLGASIRREA